MKMRNGLLAVFLAVAMVLSYMPALAFAAEGDDPVDPGAGQGDPVVQQDQGEEGGDALTGGSGDAGSGDEDVSGESGSGDEDGDNDGAGNEGDGAGDNEGDGSGSNEGGDGTVGDENNDGSGEGDDSGDESGDDDIYVVSFEYTMKDIDVFTVTENIDGYYDDGSEFFRYNSYTPQNGDSMEVTYSNGYTVTYEIADSEYGLRALSTDGTQLFYLCNEPFFYTNQEEAWTVGNGGGSYKVIVEFRGATCELPMEVTENPVKGMEFQRASGEAPKLYRYVDTEEWSESDDAGNLTTCYEYYFPGFEIGDKIVLIKDDGRQVYTYKGAEEIDGDTATFFQNDEDSSDKLYYQTYDTLDVPKIRISSDQHGNGQWEYGEHSFQVGYMGVSADFPVEICPPPFNFTEIHFNRPGVTPEGSFELEEGSSDCEPELDDNGDTYYRYLWRLEEGDTVTLKEGDDEYVYVLEEPTGFVLQGDAPDRIPKTIKSYLPDDNAYSQAQDHWTPGKSGCTMSLTAYGLTATIPVTIKANPVESISCELNGRDAFQLIESYRANYECYEEDYLQYLPEFRNGDKIIVTYTDDSVVDFVYDNGVFSSASGEVLDEYSFSCWANMRDYDYISWVPGGEGYEFTCRYNSRTCKIPAVLYENDIAGVDYTPASDEPVELVEKVDGFYPYEYEDYFEYKIKQLNTGDKLTLTYKNGTSETFECTADGEYVCGDKVLDSNYLDFVCTQNYDKPWTAGNTYEDAFWVKYKGVNADKKVKVRIVSAECEHVWNDGEVTTAATCTTDGVKTFTCTKCHETRTETIPATGHTEETLEAKAATCTEPGLTEGKKCSVCGEILAAQEEIPAAGHTWNDGEVTTAPRPGKAGVKTFTCTVCGETEAKAIPALPRINLSKAAVTGISAKVYTGKALTQNPVVKLDGKTLRVNTDYKLTYSANTNVGKATVTITGVGEYTGKISKTFNINPKGTSLSTLTAAKKAFTAKWKTQTAKMSKSTITGYQIQYSTNKNFKSGNKTANVTGAKTASKKIAKLTAKKTYYVRIRTYMKVGGTTYYSGWSAAKSVKTK